MFICSIFSYANPQFSIKSRQIRNTHVYYLAVDGCSKYAVKYEIYWKSFQQLSFAWAAPGDSAGAFHMRIRIEVDILSQLKYAGRQQLTRFDRRFSQTRSHVTKLYDFETPGVRLWIIWIVKLPSFCRAEDGGYVRVGGKRGGMELYNVTFVDNPLRALHVSPYLLLQYVL